MTNFLTRKALASDKQWIVAEMIEGKRDGHFRGEIDRQATQIFEAIISKKPICIVSMRNGVTQLQASNYEIFVVELDSIAAGYLITRQTPNEIELHLCGTKKEYRRRGVFAKLVTQAIANSVPTTKIYARCYKKSSWAIAGFEKLGFKVSKLGDPKELIL